MTDRGPRQLSVRQAYEKYLNRIRRDRADATVNTKKYNLIHFVRWCEDHEIETPDDDANESTRMLVEST